MLPSTGGTHQPLSMGRFGDGTSCRRHPEGWLVNAPQPGLTAKPPAVLSLVLSLYHLGVDMAGSATVMLLVCAHSWHILCTCVFAECSGQGQAIPGAAASHPQGHTPRGGRWQGSWAWVCATGYLTLSRTLSSWCLGEPYQVTCLEGGVRVGESPCQMLAWWLRYCIGRVMSLVTSARRPEYSQFIEDTPGAQRC